MQLVQSCGCTQASQLTETDGEACTIQDSSPATPRKSGQFPRETAGTVRDKRREKRVKSVEIVSERLLRQFLKAGQFEDLAVLARPFGGCKRGCRQGSGILGKRWYLTHTEASSDVLVGLPNTMTAVTQRLLETHKNGR